MLVGVARSTDQSQSEYHRGRGLSDWGRQLAQNGNVEMLFAHERWVGPFKIRRLLESCLDRESELVPPAVGSAYVVTKRAWQSAPSRGSELLYVGGNTGKSERFRTRIGDVIADAFGLFSTPKTGHSSGGQSLHKWCFENGVHPFDLHIAWVRGAECHRCLECRLYGALKPQLNKVRPKACGTHV